MAGATGWPLHIRDRGHFKLWWIWWNLIKLSERKEEDGILAFLSAAHVPSGIGQVGGKRRCREELGGVKGSLLPLVPVLTLLEGAV